jgi:hypothetical protein
MEVILKEHAHDYVGGTQFLTGTLACFLLFQ